MSGQQNTMSQNDLEKALEELHVEIEERKRAEDALERSERRFRSMIENLSDSIFILAADGTLLYQSPMVEERTGYSAEERIDRHAMELIHEEDRPRVMALMEHILANPDDVFSAEYRFLIKDGSWISMEAWARNLLHDPAVNGIIVNARNITERLKMENELRESEARYRLLANNVYDVIWTMNLELKMTYVSPSNERMFGYSPEEALAKQLDELMTPESIAKVGEVFQDVIEREQRGEVDPTASRTLEIEMYCKDGSLKWVEVKASFLKGDEGEPVGIIGTTREITERKEAEADRARLEGQLTQSQKMEAIGRLAGGVAHDFNNLLTGIQGYSEIILQSLQQNDPLARDVEEIRKAADRAAGLTQQLLAFSRKQMIEPKVIDLNEIIADSQSMLGRIIGEDIELVFEPGGELGFVKADPHQIDQVLVNLAVNARDAMPDVGRLVIETANVWIDEATARNNPGLRPEEYVRLSMRDTGCGMDGEMMTQVFEPFFSTKEKGKGTGLGLSTVFGIVKQNNGYIDVDSETGVGTTFWIYLPRVAWVEGAGKDAPVSPSLRGGETILLVEDEDMVRGFAKKVLERHGYTVIDVDDGGDAYLVLKKYEGPIHLLVTDVILPHMNGKELFDQLVEIKPALKVLYMSGYTDDVIAHHGVLDEGTPFMQKPFTIEFLTRKVREALDG